MAFPEGRSANLAEPKMDLINILPPLLLMTLLGIPHGALDGYVIRTVSRNVVDCGILLGLYVCIAVACIGIWMLYPTVAMVAFLLISTAHFGRSDVISSSFARPLIAIVARGGLWTIAVPVFHWQSTEVFFDYLQTDSELVGTLLSAVLIPWICVSILHLLTEIRHSHSGVCIEWLVGLGVVILLPPLWALCVYFCAWHARRHMIKVLSTAADVRHGIRDMLFLTLITLCIASLIYFFYARHIDLAPATITVFFVGLFALTVPHMVLVDYYLPHHYPHWRLKK